ncbi:MAG: MerR family DNA-binding protein [Burkholderiales bacterium]|nr:MerR family DNA-binding protein [Burkholderiales bacterium]
MGEVRRTIGGLARAVGVSVETVRYYQRIGLLPAPPRAHGTIRRYPPETLARLRFIRRAQGLGFTLEEVGALLALSVGEHCAETRALGERKLALVQRKIDQLAAIRAALGELVARCAQGGRSRGCPLIEALSRDAE